MDGTFSTYEGFGKVVKYPDRKRSLRGDILVDGKIMLKQDLKDIQCESAGRIQPAKARSQWQSLVSRQ